MHQPYQLLSKRIKNIHVYDELLSYSVLLQKIIWTAWVWFSENITLLLWSNKEKHSVKYY